MDFREIVDKLNQLAENSKVFKDLQIIRTQLRGLTRPGTYKIFSQRSTFDDDIPYAFHDGGRSELQFNVAAETYEGKEIFRYGLAFSLAPNRSQPDPINYITPKIRAFNAWYQMNPAKLDKLQVWHYRDDKSSGRSNDFNAMKIPDNWIVWGNFIFLGKYFKKPVGEINEDDLLQIIKLFDEVMPIYQYVEANSERYRLSIAGERIARICWNDNGWVMPSGRPGKSEDSDTHEGKYGYGHEEWLGDVSKLVDGYHYSFLEPVRENQQLPGNKYKVDLFAFNGITRMRYVVGTIDEVEIIDPETAENIKTEYKSRGWMDLMEKQIIAAQANSKGFSNWHGVDLFNIRFKPSNLHLFSEYRQTNDQRILDIQRYVFAHKTAEIDTVISTAGSFSFIPENPNLPNSESGDVETTSYEKEPKPIEITYLHKRIRDELKNYFIHRYGSAVCRENPTGHGTLIDLVREEENSKLIFYEIKTYNSIKLCIREALGQLLEYCHWPDRTNAFELIIVSQNYLTQDSKIYLSQLRNRYTLRIYYQQFIWQEHFLSEKY